MPNGDSLDSVLYDVDWRLRGHDIVHSCPELTRQ